MAQQFTVNVYQINSSAIALVDVVPMSFPSAGVMLRSLNTSSPTPLSTGVYVYGLINLLATGATYATTQTAAQIATLANA